MEPEPQPIKGAVKQAVVASMDAVGLQPINHVWTVLRYAWSVRLMALASVLIFLEPVISAGAQYITVNSVWIQMGVASLIGLVGVAAIWARVTFQTTLRTKIAEKEQADGEPLS